MIFALTLALLSGTGTGTGTGTATTADAQAHAAMLVLDTHLDAPANFGRAGWDIGKRHTVANDLTQLDLPRMHDGGLDGGFFVIFTPQGPLTKDGYARARTHALRRAITIRETVASHRDQMELAFTVDDARRIAATGKRVVFQSIENSYAVGDDLAFVETFHALGVRMAGPVHSKTNQLADSSTDKAKWGGLSPLGKRWVAAMNRAGMIIDASHASDAALTQMIALSKTPVVLSHTGTKKVFAHPRNIDDALLKRLAASGGVIQMNSLFLGPINESPALGAVVSRLDVSDTLSVDEQAAVIAAYNKLPEHERATTPSASFDTFMAGLLHVIEVAGVDHVGIGADWDGGGGVAGLDDVADVHKITTALRAKGFSDADIEKIWSGNVLRVLALVEKSRAAP